MQFMKQNMQKVFRKDNTFSLVQMDSFMLLVILSFYDNCMYSISRDLVPVFVLFIIQEVQRFLLEYFYFSSFLWLIDIFRRQRGGNKTYRGIADILGDKVSNAQRFFKEPKNHVFCTWLYFSQILENSSFSFFLKCRKVFIILLIFRDNLPLESKI